MNGKIPSAKDIMEARPLAMKNPYILNFCRALVEKKGEKHSPESLKKLLNDMYQLFENLLGQNMVKALPEEKRKEYREMSEDLQNLTYDKIAEIFDRYIPNHKEIMKQTMVQFAELFMKNRIFDADEIKKQIINDKDIVLD